MSTSQVVAPALGAALVGCAARRQDPCDPPDVPADAKIVATHGVDFAVHPEPLPPGFTGCQHTWIGDGSEPRSMQHLSTAYFLDGRVQWLSAREPKGPEYRCVYRDGALVAGASPHAEKCPRAHELERR
jgi:hypothetical protein